MFVRTDLGSTTMRLRLPLGTIPGFLQSSHQLAGSTIRAFGGKGLILAHKGPEQEPGTVQCISGSTAEQILMEMEACHVAGILLLCLSTLSVPCPLKCSVTALQDVNHLPLSLVQFLA